jgi:HlyD family secretion protein
MRTRAAIVLAFAILLTACSGSGDEGWLGYVEGETALIAPPQPGWILTLNVARGQEVRAGDVLFTLDTTSQIAARNTAASQMKAAQDAIGMARAEVVRTQKELARQQRLVRIGGTPKSVAEQAKAAFDSASAQLAQLTATADAARATLANAEWALSERTVRAKSPGRVEDIFFRAGEYANAGVPVVALLPRENVYVRFFIPEPALAGARLNQKVRVSCDGCPANLTAEISFIAAQSEFTPPVIYSVDNREKLVFRAEARAPALSNLRPGLPVTVTPAE